MKISTSAWAILIAGISMTAYAFAVFETKDHIKDVFGMIDARLSRIETKIDAIKR